MLIIRAISASESSVASVRTSSARVPQFDGIVVQTLLQGVGDQTVFRVAKIELLEGAISFVPCRSDGKALYVREHNAELPHSAFRGQTPDEMYFGTGEGVPDDLKARRREARAKRMETNRARSCRVCRESTSS